MGAWHYDKGDITMGKYLAQKDRVIKYLLKNKYLTSYQAQDKLGIARLAARVSELNKSERIISKITIEVPTRFGSGRARIARYYLTDEAKRWIKADKQ